MRKIYVFYADVFLLQNLCLDYAAVMGSNLLLKRGEGILRLFAVSALSSFLGLLLLLSVRDMAWYQLLTHFVLNTGMVLGCFGIGTKKQFLENWLVTYFMVLLLGGGMEWLREQGVFPQYHFLQILLAVALLFSALAYLLRFKAFGNHIFPGTVHKDMRQIKIRAYWDSGNQLRDPYTGKAVSILSHEKAAEFIDAKKDSIRFVPYRSLGEQNGLLRVTDIERLELLWGSKRIVIKNAAIGLAEQGLFEGKAYDMILHASVCEENAKENKSVLKKESEKQVNGDMYIKLRMPGKGNFWQEMRSFSLTKLLFREKDEVHYIGGAEILPPPLESEEEARCIELLGTEGTDGKGCEAREDARKRLIEHNLRLVVYIAKKFDNTGVGVEDLISIGTIGLIKAINTFNPNKNIKLATYASRCIENEILMYLRRNNKTKLEVSIDEPLNVDWDGNELLLSDILGTDEDVIYRDIETDVERRLLKGAIEKLSGRERMIIELRFGLNSLDGEEKTQKEVADMLGISQSYISRLEKKIMVRLKREIVRLE